MEHGAVRWAVNSGSWSPSELEFSTFINLLPISERPQVLRYVKFEDKKKALISRLLQRKLVHSVLNIDYDHIVIERTREGKPYLANSVEHEKFPNFNFNVSHHGSYVVLASEPLCVIGVDVMTSESNMEEQPTTFFKPFKDCLTKSEWDMVLRAGATSSFLYQQFYRLWCLKEAYIKAIGIGLGFDLLRAEFFYPTGDIWSNMASVRIDSQEKTNWRFFLHKLDDHWICVAKGSPDEAVTSFRDTLRLVRIDSISLQMALEAHEKDFSILDIWNLVPDKYKLEFKL